MRICFLRNHLKQVDIHSHQKNNRCAPKGSPTTWLLLTPLQKVFNCFLGGLVENLLISQKVKVSRSNPIAVKQNPDKTRQRPTGTPNLAEQTRESGGMNDMERTRGYPLTWKGTCCTGLFPRRKGLSSRCTKLYSVAKSAPLRKFNS